MSENEKSLRLEQQEAAAKLKRQQEKVRNRFDFLKNVPARHFQAEYVKAQAEEICKYVNDIGMTPLNAWYSSLTKLVSTGEFMSTFYLTYNEFDVIVPDYDRIESLVLPEPKLEDFPRGTVIFA